MPARQITQPKITDSDTKKMLHMISDGSKHPANLPLDSLQQNNAQKRRRHRVKSRNSRSLTIEMNATQQFRRERRVPRTIQCHFVFFLDFVTWMGEALGKLAISCKEKQALGLCVQAPNVEQPRKFCRQQIENSVADVRISPRGDESGGLMEHDGERRGDPNKFTIHFDVIATAGLRAEVRADFTVDRDPPRRDQFIAITARSDTGCGEKTVETHNRDSQFVKS
jgi:hypothetical protein